MTPDTSKTQIRGPDAFTHACSEPLPLALRLVTRMILPPRPAGVSIPNPTASGMTGSAEAAPAEQLRMAKAHRRRHCKIFIGVLPKQMHQGRPKSIRPQRASHEARRD